MPGEDTVADTLTKPLERKKFVRLREYLLNMRGRVSEMSGAVSRKLEASGPRRVSDGGCPQEKPKRNSEPTSLNSKLSKLRGELLQDQAGSGGGGEGFAVPRSGDGRVALIGFPSVGKSSLLSTLTTTQSEAAGYEFTTLTCIPGNIIYNDTRIQLLDLPGIIEGAAHGKGRGK